MTPIDMQYAVETPEGIDLHVEVAGPVVRGLAYAIDLFIRAVVLVTASAFLLIGERVGLGLMLILSFLLEWFYPVAFEVLMNGQTPGKKALGLAVVNDDLTPISLGSSVIRNLLRTADFLPFAYLFGLASMTLSSRFQRLGDLAAGTVVVYRADAEHAGTLPECQPVQPNIALSMDEQTALIDFAQRHEHLSEDRQRELAEILQNVTGRRGKTAIEYLQGIGAWLVGLR